MQFHEAVAHALQDNGVTTIFGLIGDANMYLMDSFERCTGGRYISVAHESAAVLAANGYAQVSGGLGAASVTQGPGVTNTVTALLECVHAHTPVLVIAGDTDPIERAAPGALSQQAVVEASGAGFVEVRAPETVAEEVATSVRRARYERRPVVLNVPKHFLWDEVDYESRAAPRFTRALPPVVPEALDEAVGIIAAASRPIVLAGRGAIDPAARAALLRLSARIGAPVATSLRARDLFLDQPGNLGIFGTLSGEVTIDVIQRSDCVIVFGAGLNERTTGNGALIASKAIVRVDLEPTAIDTSPPRSVGILGDSAVVADAMVSMLDAAEVKPTRFASPELATRLAEQAPVGRSQPGGRRATVDIRAALRRIDVAVRADRTLVIDGGRFIASAHAELHVTSPQRYVHSLHCGSIGLGMANSLGAAVADPTRPVLTVCGDGGFMLGGLAEFNTAVRHGLDVVVIVLNDGAYGAEYVRFRDLDMDPAISTFNWPEFADVATALGGCGYSVRSLEELDTALAALPDRSGPVLIDVKIDPDSVPAAH
jgi:thiamine pyrophosphate-dependent acetolactate synthase large subunit-like protein